MTTPFTPALIATGTTANDGTGDSPRAVGQKINANLKAIAALLNSLPAGQGAALATALVAGLMKPGATMTIAQDGTIDVIGATVASLTTADPATLGAGTLVVTVGGIDKKTTGAALIAGQGVTPDSLPTADPTTLGAGTVVMTIGGIDKRTTGAGLLAYNLANDGSADLAQSTALSTIPNDFEVVGISNGQPAVLLWSTLKAGLGSSSGNTTPAAATTYVISTSSMGTVGTAQPINVSVTGTLNSPAVVTLADDASGAFGGTVTLPAGTNTSGTTQYAPASAGTRTISATNNGGLTNPSGPSVTVAAAASSGGGTSTTSAMTMSGATYADRGDGSGKKMLTIGSGSVPVTIPANGNFFVLMGLRGGTDFSYADSSQFLSLVNASGVSVGAKFLNRFAVVVANNGTAGDPAPASITDGNMHIFAFESVSGVANQSQGSYNLYSDGSAANGSRPGNYGVNDAAGACTLMVQAGTMPKVCAGLFDIRVYAGSVASPGALLGRWPLDGSGAAS